MGLFSFQFQISSKFLTSSLPGKVSAMKKKRINFSLMENKAASLHEIDKSILESPDIPFSADRKPKQGVLKKSSSSSSINTTPNGNDKKSVAYNTMLNGRSRFLKRRSVASDFFWCEKSFRFKINSIEWTTSFSLVFFISILVCLKLFIWKEIKWFKISTIFFSWRQSSSAQFLSCHRVLEQILCSRE